MEQQSIDKLDSDLKNIEKEIKYLNENT